MISMCDITHPQPLGHQLLMHSLNLVNSCHEVVNMVYVVSCKLARQHRQVQVVHGSSASHWSLDPNSMFVLHYFSPLV
jgi:hypothetical protein